MQIDYYKESSRFLNRDMEFKVFGHKGLPCLCFACEGGRFYDFEDRGLVAALSPLIEAGRIQLFCADSIDQESWMSSGNGRFRAEQQERWFNYLCLELVPRALALNGPGGTPHARLFTLGISLGAGHAVTLALRRPQLFCGAIGFSGSYRASEWFGDYADDLTLRNSPVDLLLRLSPEQRAALKNTSLLLCCGQGAYEDRFLASSQALTAALERAGLRHQLELWGADSSHDWPWWQKQLPLLVEQGLQLFS